MRIIRQEWKKARTYTQLKKISLNTVLQAVDKLPEGRFQWKKNKKSARATQTGTSYTPTTNQTWEEKILKLPKKDHLKTQSILDCLQQLERQLIYLHQSSKNNSFCDSVCQQISLKPDDYDGYALRLQVNELENS